MNKNKAIVSEINKNKLMEDNFNKMLSKIEKKIINKKSF
jgi:hypothetical protein